jgi:uncharacterized UPF0160 family protein
MNIKTKQTKPKLIVTHSGPFHADEVFAVALLFCAFGTIPVIRTRDMEIIKQHFDDPDAWVIDVGGRYNPAYHNYDHHQIADNLIGLYSHTVASFGLVFKSIAAEWSIRLREDLVTALVEPIDSCDNGRVAKPASLSTVISSFNPTWDGKEDFDDRFHRAVEFAAQVIGSRYASAQALIRAEDYFFNAVVVNGIIRLDRYAPFIPFVNKINAAKPASVLGIVFPAVDGNWCVRGCSIDGVNRDIQTLLPKAWRGKTGEELQKISGLDDAVFVHKSGYIGSFGTRKNALEAAATLHSKYLAVYATESV